MKETAIRKKAIDQLKDWQCWYPPKVRWRKEGDIFGVIDLVAVKKKKHKWIQLTTLTNIRAREKKVLKWKEETGAKIPVEVWGWDKKYKRFKILKV